MSKWDTLFSDCNAAAAAAAAAKARSESNELPAGAYTGKLEKAGVASYQNDDGETVQRPWIMFRVTQCLLNPALEGRTAMWSPRLLPDKDGKCIDAAKLLSMYKELFNEEAPAVDGVTDERGKPLPNPYAAFGRIADEVVGTSVQYQFKMVSGKGDNANRVFFQLGKLVRGN